MVLELAQQARAAKSQAASARVGIAGGLGGHAGLLDGDPSLAHVSSFEERGIGARVSGASRATGARLGAESAEEQVGECRDLVETLMTQWDTRM